MSVMELYNVWCDHATDDPDLQTELKSIAGKEDEISDDLAAEWTLPAIQPGDIATGFTAARKEISVPSAMPPRIPPA